MKEIKLDNIRSLKSTGAIPILPITLLVGENSSGKSTFLRVFPLLKQSIMKKTNGPLLWAGDVDDYVDFGSFEETVTNDGAKSMGLSFSFEIKPDNLLTSYYYQFRADDSKNLPIKTEYGLIIEKSKDKEYVSKLSVKLNDTFIRIEGLNKTQVTISVNDHRLKLPVIKESGENKNRSFFWRAFLDRSLFGIQLSTVPAMTYNYVSSYLNIAESTDAEKDGIVAALLMIGKKLIQGQSLDDLMVTIHRQNHDNSQKANQSSLFSRTNKQADQILNQISNLTDEEMETVIDAIKVFFFVSNHSSIEEYLAAYFSQVHYIAPIRATAERYYRLRNSAIDEVDYQGKNLAIFLNSLPESRLSQFQEWTTIHFGFKACVSKTKGHLSIEINREGQAGKINLSDTGFGYSQILPIITQLWELSSKKSSHKRDEQAIPLVIAIEQPELHLHPAMQAKLAEAFIAAISLAKDNGYSLQLILETHSETMINYFGRSIARGKLNSDDVAVILFDRDGVTNQTVTTISKYDCDGFLENWPIGFFAPED